MRAVGGNIAFTTARLTGFLAQFRRRFPQHCHVKTRVLAVNTRILERCILQLDAVSASSAAVSNSLRKHFGFGCSAHEFSHGLVRQRSRRTGVARLAQEAEEAATWIKTPSIAVRISNARAYWANQ